MKTFVNENTAYILKKNEKRLFAIYVEVVKCHMDFVCKVSYEWKPGAKGKLLRRGGFIREGREKDPRSTSKYEKEALGSFSQALLRALDFFHS